MEDTQEDGVTVVNHRILRRRMQHVLQGIFACAIPARKCQRGSLQEALVVGLLEVPILVLRILLPVPKERTVRSSPKGLQLLSCENTHHLVLVHIATCIPCSSAKTQRPLACHHGISLEHPNVFLDCSQLLSKGLAVEEVLKAVVAVHVEAHISVPAARGLRPLRHEGLFSFRALEDRENHGDTARIHASLSNDVHGPGIVRDQRLCRNFT
mmetsp:Transcript_39096/g.93414  ORF Transcript_39096/g.93414 Transcript_39096/m.93414 type:complete len:211 (-) Transcript_39096:610-1242(-)